MKLFFRRLVLRRRLDAMLAHVADIQRQREMLNLSERHCVCQIAGLQLALLNLKSEARRHA